MTLNIISVTSDDGINLPGFLFKSNKDTNKVVIFVHGNEISDGFDKYSEIEKYATYFCNAGIDYLYFNNRGARYIQKFKVENKSGNSNTVYGGRAFEIIEDCVHDINGAVNFLTSMSYKELYLIGASTGANKAVLYNKYIKNNKIKKMILSSGVDDISIIYKLLGHDQFSKILVETNESILSGYGEEISKYKVGKYIFSNKTLHNILDPNGDYNIFPFDQELQLKIAKKPLFSEINEINIPTLFCYGELDEYMKPSARFGIEMLKNKFIEKTNFQYALVKDADHAFYGKEDVISQIEIEFILK